MIFKNGGGRSALSTYSDVALAEGAAEERNKNDTPAMGNTGKIHGKCICNE